MLKPTIPPTRTTSSTTARNNRQIIGVAPAALAPRSAFNLRSQPRSQPRRPCRSGAKTRTASRRPHAAPSFRCRAFPAARADITSGETLGGTKMLLSLRRAPAGVLAAPAAGTAGAAAAEPFRLITTDLEPQ